MTNIKFLNLATPNWCPGCGDFGILLSLQQAIAELNIEQHNLLLVSGIGCSSKIPYWVKVYGFNSLHGRALPVAIGAKLANNKLNVVVAGGDGDGYGEGGNHFLHAMRRNIDITYLVHNNQIYALTTGQASPSTEEGDKNKVYPHGVIERPIQALAIAVANGATFVARGFAGNVPHLTDLIKQAIQHKGFALIDIAQPCVTFNHHNTYDFFRQRIYDLQKEGHDFKNKTKAFEKALEWGEKIPIGIIYKEERKTFEEKYPQIAKKPLSQHDISFVDIQKAMDKMC
ncbi:2-oxoacid:ferredoxin oxidoreductase subunit beta [Candidatus Woesearchaeota archaeon]|nr:MAG: 2-oxoacid:ferredoxin oxidoreductase subunit beta [Candidatus Woesearchaeota archaeon]